MAAPRSRFPYGIRPAPHGGVYAQQANGREILLTGNAAKKAQRDYAAQAALRPTAAPAQTVDPDFDAHQYQVMAEAAYALPRTARGGVRDLAPDDAAPMDVGAEAASMATDRAMPATPTPAAPTLAETQESAAYRQGVTPDPAQQWDTVYVDPAEEERKRKAAALPGARVRHGEDVAWYDPEKPVSL